MSEAFPRMKFYRLFLIVAPIILAKGKHDKCDKKIDLAIILDSSASIGEENFQLSKEFVKKLCRRFAIAEDKVHVSITSYSMYETTMPSFTDSYNEKTIESDVDKHVYEASSTRTGRALKVVIERFNKQKDGARAKDPDVKRVAVIVTDGFSSTGVDFMKEKAGLLRKAGIETFVVGITQRMNDEELKILSSKPTKLHLFSLTNSTVVNGVVDSIVKQVCK